MKINRNSWHYKLNIVCDDYPSKNLCGYFWRNVIKIGIMFFIGIVLYICGFLVCTDPSFVYTLSVILYVISTLVLPMIGINYFRKWKGSSTEIPGESVVKEFIKAKKNKMCPMIEYIDK